MVPRPHLQAITGRQEALSGRTAALSAERKAVPSTGRQAVPFTADLHQASHHQAVQAHHTAAVLQAIHTAAAVHTGAQAVLTEVPAVPHLPTGVLQAVLPLRIEVPAAVPLTGAAGHPTAEAVLTEVPVAATPEAEFHVLPAEVPAEQSGDINGDINYDKYEKTDNSNSSARGICC